MLKIFVKLSAALLATSVISAVLLALPAVAQKITILSYGAQKCEEWTIARKFPSDSILRAGFEGWVLGYLSGMAIATGQNSLRDSTSFAIYRSIDQRCELKPLELIGNAATAV